MSAHRIIASTTAITAAAMLACSGSTGGSATGTNTNQLGGPTPSGGTAPDTGAPASPGASDPGAAGSGGTGSTSLTSGLGTFSGWLVDAPNPDVSEIHVTVTSVTIHLAGAGWIPLANGVTYPVSVDLLKLQDTAAALGFATLPPGTITQIRLLVADQPDANYVVLKNPADPTHPSVPLKVPSGYESGIKIMGPWRIEACTDTAVTIDFDGHKSIWYHPTGQGDEWILRPVIRVRGAVSRPIACPAPVDGGGGGTPLPTDGGTTPGTVTAGNTCTATTDCAQNLTCVSAICVAPDGTTCTANSECASSSCASGVCTTVTPPPPPPPPPPVPLGGACDATNLCDSNLACSGGTCLRPDGGSCTANTECVSGNCSSGVCTTPVVPPAPVPLGGNCQATTDCASNLTCSAGKCLLPDGNTCTANIECVSGNCSSSTCTAPVVPPTPTPLNGSCTATSECVTGLVCSSGQCLVPPGGQCTTATACASGYCSTSGTCLTPVGGTCTYGIECSSGTCNANTCAPGSAGSQCLYGTECLSGTCGTGGTCAVGSAGAPCAVSADCSTGTCSAGRCSSPSPLPISSACSANSDCLQNNCSGGTCQPGAAGAVCGTSTDCQSNICSGGFCAAPVG